MIWTALDQRIVSGIDDLLAQGISLDLDDQRWLMSNLWEMIKIAEDVQNEVGEGEGEEEDE